MDRINNNFNKSNTSFSGINKDSKEMNKESIMNNIVKNCQKAINDVGDRYVPENGKFEKFNISFDIPESSYQGLVTVEADRKVPENQRRLSVRIHHKNSDRIFSNYLFTGTKKEVFDYSQKEEFVSSFLDSIDQLIKSADDYYSSL